MKLKSYMFNVLRNKCNMRYYSFPKLLLTVVSYILCFVLGSIVTDLLKERPNIQNVRTVVIILSAPGNVEQRNAIRGTWLKHLDWQSRHLFVVGEGNRDMIYAELDEHEDILLVPVLDSYMNLTAKLLATLVYVFNTYKFDYILKVDDDSFVNTKLLQEVLIPVDNNKPLYWGYFNGRATPFKRGKWKEDQWFLCDRYLPYAIGGGYILSYSAVELIVGNKKFLSLYKSEDVSVGTWLAPYNITRLHDVRFDSGHLSRGCSNSHILSHKKNPETIREMYNNLIKYGSPCREETRLYPAYEYDWKAPPSKCCQKLIPVSVG